jgi:hypothetical protein
MFPFGTRRTVSNREEAYERYYLLLLYYALGGKKLGLDR